MKKHFLFRLGTVLLLLALLPTLVSASAVNPNANCSITLHYTKEEAVFPDLEIEIRRVASVTSFGYFGLVPPYDSWPVNIHGITSQTEWKTATQTLCAYVSANNTGADYTAKTDKNGTVVFPDLKTGMYLVSGKRVETDKAVYQFDPFLVCLPTPLSDGTQDYHVEARPKCSEYTPKEQYTVVKLWKDQGYTYQRPTSVTVEIYKDTTLFDTVTLNKDNNWSYSWTAVPDSSVWSVVETDVSSKYKVTVSSNAATFTITNTRDTTTDEPPKTGDTFPYQAYMTAMCLSGSLLMILGVLGKRKKQ